jgi:hypothetical protein
VETARDRAFVITESPLDVVRIAFAGQGAMRVIGSGLRHGKAPHPDL